LGCYKTPSHNYKPSLELVRATAMAKSDAVLHRSIDAWCTQRYYYSVFPSNRHEFEDGLARTTPHVILYGPQTLGGAGLRSFYDKQGSSQTELVIKHLRSSATVTIQLHIALA
jgi:hypothetical protein